MYWWWLLFISPVTCFLPFERGRKPTIPVITNDGGRAMIQAKVLSNITVPNEPIHLPFPKKIITKVAHFVETGNFAHSNHEDLIQILNVGQFLDVSFLIRASLNYLADYYETSLGIWKQFRFISRFSEHAMFYDWLTYLKPKTLMSMNKRYSSVKAELKKDGLLKDIMVAYDECGPELSDLRNLRAPNVTLYNPTPQCFLSLHKVKLQIEPNQFIKIFVKTCSMDDLQDVIHVLDLSHCSLSHLRPLHHISSLVALKLHNNSLSNLDGLESLTELSYLDASSNMIHSLRTIPALKSLNLSMNGITSLEHFEPQSLTILDLSFNKISSLRNIHSFGNTLQKLWMHHNRIENVSLLTFGSLLRHLDISFNHIFDLEPLSYLELRKLSATGNPCYIIRHLRRNYLLDYFQPFASNYAELQEFWAEVDSSPIEVDRLQVFESAKLHFLDKQAKDFASNKIRFVFMNEQGQDAGGLTKEFVTLFMDYVFKSNRWFTLLEDGSYYYSKVPVTEKLKAEYYYIARVFALAWYAQIPIGFVLNDTFWKLLVNAQFTLDDFKLFDPAYHRSLQQILDMPSIDSLGLTFTTDDGQPLSSEYSANDLVTARNVKHYVQAKLLWIVQTQYEPQWTAFKKGFKDTFTLSSPFPNWKHLKEKLTGKANIDLQDWLENIVWTTISPAKQQFEQMMLHWWIHDQLDRLKQLLQFVTGLKHVPSGGFNKLNPPFTIRIVNGMNRLPTARTCFNSLELSHYTDSKMLEKQLMTAMREGEMFSSV